jgi:hypothetical protein
MVQAHRYAWEQANGRRLQPDEQVLHHCDVPLCIEPSHLFLGSQQDNMDDMVAKGRHWQQAKDPLLCPKGHAKLELGECKVCQRENWRAADARRRERRKAETQAKDGP